MRDVKQGFYAGFSRVDITPENGVAIEGYFIPRRVEGVLDVLEVNTLALAEGEKQVVILCADICLINQDYMDILRSAVSENTGIPVEAVFMSVTHTHTSPCVGKAYTGDVVMTDVDHAYLEKLIQDVVSAAQKAIDNLKPARMGWGIGNAPGIAFSRRIRMKDGSVRTNPGLHNPDALEAIGEMDERVNVLRFDQEDGDNIVIVNYGNHPDSIGGCKVSADWPGVMRRTVETSIPGTKCMFLNGVEGDVGHVNIWAKDGEMNDLTIDFDDVIRGFGHTLHMGRVVAGAVLQVYDKVNYTQENKLRFVEKIIDVPSNRPKESELELAHKYNELHKAGKDNEIPHKGMMLTTVVAEAERMVRLENGPDSFPMKFAAVAIGDVAILGIPGEPFTDVGVEIKKAEGFKMVMPCSNANGAEGYFPTKNAYDEGGYEARSSYFKCGAAEYIVDECKKILSII